LHTRGSWTSTAHGRDCQQPPRYSLLDRAIEIDLLPYCHQHDIAVLAYSPLEQGLLTGKIKMDTVFSPEIFRNNLPWFAPEKRQRVLAMLDGWRPLAQKYTCSLSQLAIAWTITQSSTEPTSSSR
jgi:methylglyoxal reductase